MTSTKFIEILEPTQAPTYTHPHLNVSLDDILREGRERSASQSSGSDSSAPKSPTEDKNTSNFVRRLTLGKKARRAS